MFKTEQDGTDGTSFTGADSHRVVFMCMTEHTRNTNGTALSQTLTGGSLFLCPGTLKTSFLALFRLFWAFVPSPLKTDGTNSSFTRAAWRTLFRCSVSPYREKHTALLLQTTRKCPETEVFSPKTRVQQPFCPEKPPPRLWFRVQFCRVEVVKLWITTIGRASSFSLFIRPLVGKYVCLLKRPQHTVKIKPASRLS
jgi:hypothetical protein